MNNRHFVFLCFSGNLIVIVSDNIVDNFSCYGQSVVCRSVAGLVKI